MSETIEEKKVKAWARLVRASGSLLMTIEAQLKSEGLPPLVWYDVLHELACERPSGLRQYQLQGQMLLQQYNLSRLLSRMEKRGVIAMKTCPQDRRGKVIHITKQGLRLRREMWGIYGVAIRELFAKKLSADESVLLLNLLKKISL